MTWDEFEDAVKRLNLDGAPDVLFMEGVMFDNQTSYLIDAENKSFKEVSNKYKHVVNPSHFDSDFVWVANKVRIGAGMFTGGHPALAGTHLPYCAGRIETWGLFFHSGHYHPKRPHALFFVADMIRNSCNKLFGSQRDEMVDAIAKTKLRIYADNSETNTFDTTLEEQYQKVGGGSKSNVNTTSSFAFAPPKPQTFGFGMNVSSSTTSSINNNNAPMTTTFSSTTNPVETKKPTPDTLGLSLSGRAVLATRVEHNRARTITKAEATKCGRCNTKFGIFRKPHLCRQCGHMFCDSCSKQKKVVKYPAAETNEDPNQYKVRVCNTCFLLEDPTK